MMQKENPLVSVIIPTYKRPETINRAINSVLQQTYRNFEIIVVDDNNPDTAERRKTEDVMGEYKDSDRVIYIKHEKNKNGSAARNTGIAASKGKYIMLLDDDDEFLPEKMEAQVSCLEERDESWGACYTRYYDVNSSGKILMTCAEKREGNLLLEELKRNLFVHAGSNLMVRKQIVDEIGGFNESFLRNQDMEFLVRILKKYQLAYTPVFGVKVYKHGYQQKKDFDELTALYLDAFKDEINSLNEADKKSVMTYIALQRFRDKLQSKGQKKAAIAMLSNHEVSFLNASKYCLHLLKRKITKTSYGF